MPELVPIYERLCELSGGRDVEARFLSLWCPPPYLAGCTQVAWNKNGNYLLRNYDYGNDYFDSVLLQSNWLQPVIGMVDCTWGLLDGMNASGLAASLTFGGRKVRGEGFGIPLVLRYILEVCTSVSDAISVFKRVPVHMSYNVTLIDVSGKYATLFLNPDREPQVVDEPSCANHQQMVEWPLYEELSQSAMRKKVLDKDISNGAATIRSLRARFLSAPLYNSNYQNAFGTLYTVLYNLTGKSLEVHWPGKSLTQSFDQFKEQQTEVLLEQAPTTDTLVG